VGHDVSFWSARLSRLNTLAAGVAPAAFKGFEDTPPVTACGQGWTTDPGSTPPPPGPLPPYIEIIVSSTSTQSGSSISADTEQLVIVKTNSGYAPNPGRAGPGTVVAQIC